MAILKIAYYRILRRFIWWDAAVIHKKKGKIWDLILI